MDSNTSPESTTAPKVPVLAPPLCENDTVSPPVDSALPEASRVRSTTLMALPEATEPAETATVDVAVEAPPGTMSKPLLTVPGSAGEWCWHLHDPYSSHDRQRRGTYFRLRQHHGECQHHPGLRPELPGSGGFPTACGVGTHAEHAPTIDLCEYLGAYPAWRDDFFDLYGF